VLVLRRNTCATPRTTSKVPASALATGARLQGEQAAMPERAEETALGKARLNLNLKSQATAH
jgi:hypothetical protein